MDANQAIGELCSILGVGDFMTAPTIEGCLDAARRLAAQSADAHLRLDNAGVEGGVELPARVDLLRNWVRRAQDGWAQANARLDQSNGELVAARGDLRVEKERADMLEKERDAANQELSETRQALGGFLGPDYRISEEVKKVVSIRDMLAARANEAEQKMMLAVSDLGAMTAERDTLAARVKELEAHLAPYPSHLPERPTLGLFTEGIPGAVSGTAVNPSKPGLQPMKCPCGGKIEFGRESVGYCQKCGTSCRVMDPPPDTCDHDQSLTAALVEANRNTAKWRKRAQECQKALRSLRAMTGNMLFDLDEDWGNDE